MKWKLCNNRFNHKLIFNLLIVKFLSDTFLECIKGCAFSSTGDGTYRQFVDEISQWVSYDCPAGQIFDNELCKCRGKGKNRLRIDRNFHENYLN